MCDRDLELAQAHLAAIVDSSDDAIVSKDLNGRIRSFNRAAERMFGWRAEEIIGQPVTVLIPPERQHEETEILARLRRGERVDHFETVRIAKDGRRLDISLSVSPVRNESGEIVGAAKIARDITEQKQMAQALAAEREWFRVTLKSVGDAVIATDAEGRVTFANAVAEHLTGWSTAEAVGRPLSEVFHIINEKTREVVVNPAEKVIRHGVILGLANHTVLVARNGHEWPIDDSAAPIFDDTGRILGVVLVFHDVTEQRKAAAELSEQREWFATTLASIGDAVIATDTRGHVVFLNPVAEHLTGWTAAEARGRHCDEVFHIVNEQTRQSAPNPVQQVLDKGNVVGLANHTVLIGRDGSERAIDDSGAPIRDAAGRIVGVVLVFRDVSERRRAELAIQGAAHERESLLNAERQARTEAERANRVKDDFVSLVSHELRTPLSAILSWTRVIQLQPSDLAVVEHGMEVIARNARAQAQLVSDLLDVSRMASDALGLEVEAVDLETLVGESVEAIEPMAKDRRIALRWERPGTALPRTVGDPARLKQVLLNLLGNAVKFTPEGGQIEVILRGRDDHAQIVVKDSGIGISSEDLGHLFERFGQLGSPTKRRYGGLGLGLSIAKHLVDLHGGALHAASEGEGKGATFTVELPFRKPVVTRPGKTSDAVVAGPSLEGITVLAVEDEPDMLSVMKLVIEKHGARVLTASSGAEALALLAEQPDVLVSDVRMPGMDGYELIRAIRSRDDGVSRVPAIALTAFARAEDRSRAIEAGFQAHLAKPFEPRELLLLIASFCEILGVDGP